MKIAAAVFLFNLLSWGQSTGPATTKGSCSPAVSGSRNTININVTNCGMSKEQVDEWRSLFEQILQKQIDSKVLLAVLGDIKSGQIRIENGVLRIETKLAAMKERYFVNGEKVVENGPGQFQSQDGEHGEHSQIVAAYNANDWILLKKLCENEIAKVPAWLTPYEYLGAAYAHLRQKDKAVQMLQYVVDHGSGNPDFKAVVDECRKNIEVLRQEIAQGIP